MTGAKQVPLAGRRAQAARNDGRIIEAPLAVVREAATVLDGLGPRP